MAMPARVEEKSDLLARQMPAVSVLVIGSLAAIKLLLHMATNWKYGFHRDELYYIAGGRHPALGYVDHPPLAPLLAGLAANLSGDSLGGVRLVPALIGVIVVVLTGLIAREFGGGRFAQGLAALAVLLAPLYLVSGTLFQTVGFDQLAWVAATYLVVRLIRTGDVRLWLAIGVVVGLGFLAKYTMLLWCAGLAVGLLLTPQRRQLLTPWPWLSGALAMLMAAPNIAWQIAHGWPTLEFIRNNNAAVRLDQTPGDVLASLVLFPSPAGLLLALAGLVWFFSAGGRPYRFYGWLTATVVLLLMATNGKDYYAGPLYPPLFAGGALLIDALASCGRRWLRPVAVGAVIVLGLPALPLVLPLLPPQTAADVGIFRLNDEAAEMLGWPELGDSVATVYRQLPADERARTAVLTSNYGAAGAVEMYGQRLGLPRPISGHNSYHFWGVGDPAAETFIVVGYSRASLARHFGQIDEAGVVTNQYGVENEEYGRPLYVCRQPLAPIDALWPSLRHFN